MIEKKLISPASLGVVLLKIFRVAHVRWSSLLLIVGISLAAGLFDIAGKLCIIPLLNGLLEGNFIAQKSAFPLKYIYAFLPEYLRRSNMSVFFVLLTLVLFLSLLGFVLEYIMVCRNSAMSRTVAFYLRDAIFRRYVSFGKKFYDGASTAHMNQTLVDFVYQFVVVTTQATASLASFFRVIAYLGVLFYLSWPLTVFLILVFPVLMWAQNVLHEKLKNTSRFVVSHMQDIARLSLDVFSNILLVKVFVEEENVTKSFTKLNTELRLLEISSDRKINLYGPLNKIFILFVFVFLLVLATFLSLKMKMINISKFLVYLFIFKSCADSFAGLSVFRSLFASISGLCVKIASIFEDNDKYIPEEGGAVFTGFKSVLELRDVSFGYRPGENVLTGVSFRIERGQKIALVGSTGAGKTTIINLLLRLYAAPENSIFIDGADFRLLETKSYLKHVAFVPQETLLFNDTLRSNILFGSSHVSEDELNVVIGKARLSALVASLPLGLSTMIGERGVRLSGGEKQRVSIARAMLRKGDIIILDEATSSLDSMTEMLIQEALDEALVGKTVIAIAHRYATIKKVDKVLVLEQGRIIESGSIEELIEKKGTFFTYWQEQQFY